MKAMLLVIGSWIALLASAMAETDTPSPATSPMRPVAKGNFSALTEPQREVITSQAKWNELWPKLVAKVKTSEKSPAVDFTKEMVVLIALGRKTTAGYGIEITRIEPAGDRLQIHFRRREPKRGGMALQVITSPFHAVAIPRSELEPEFIEANSDPK